MQKPYIKWRKQKRPKWWFDASSNMVRFYHFDDRRREREKNTRNTNWNETKHWTTKTFSMHLKRYVQLSEKMEQHLHCVIKAALKEVAKKKLVWWERKCFGGTIDTTRLMLKKAIKMSSNDREEESARKKTCWKWFLYT